MRVFWFSRHTLAILGGFAIACLWGGAGATPASAQQNDPVEELRAVLKSRSTINAPESELKAREDALLKAEENLKTTSDLRQALSLTEWRDLDDLIKETAAVDQKVRTKIGQRFEKIIQDVVAKGDNTSRMAAANLLGEIGTNIRALEPKDKRGYARSLAPSLITLTGMLDSDAQVRRAAARALGKVNPEPKAAVKALQALLGRKGDTGDRRAAAEALADMVRTLFTIQQLGRVQVQPGVEITIDDVMRCADEVIPATGACLQDADANVRRNGLEAIVLASAALNKFIPDPFDPALFPLPGKKWDERDRAVIKAEQDKLVAESKQFGPLLQELKAQGQNIAATLTDNDITVREKSRKALELMGTARVRLLRREASLPTEPGIEQPPPPKMPTDPLFQALEPGLTKVAEGAINGTLSVKVATLNFLEAMEDAAAPAIPVLIHLLQDRDRFVRWAAARTLGKLGTIRPEWTPQAVRGIAALLIADEDSDVREVAANALRRYGPMAKPALPELIKMLNVGEAESQEAVIKALISIGGSETTDAIPALVKSLDARSPAVRRLAAEALGRMGPLALRAERDLRDHLEDEDASVRIAISDALLNISRPR